MAKLDTYINVQGLLIYKSWFLSVTRVKIITKLNTRLQKTLGTVITYTNSAECDSLSAIDNP